MLQYSYVMEVTLPQPAGDKSWVRQILTKIESVVREVSTATTNVGKSKESIRGEKIVPISVVIRLSSLAQKWLKNLIAEARFGFRVATTTKILPITTIFLLYYFYPPRLFSLIFVVLFYQLLILLLFSFYKRAYNAINIIVLKLSKPRGN